MEVFTRRFDRPHTYTDQAMRRELEKVPATWRIYGTTTFPRGRYYHVEFRVPYDDMADLKAALENLGRQSAPTNQD